MIILLWERETEKIVTYIDIFFFFLTRKGSLTIASAVKLIYSPLEKSHNHREVTMKSDLQIKV